MIDQSEIDGPNEPELMSFDEFTHRDPNSAYYYASKFLRLYVSNLHDLLTLERQPECRQTAVPLLTVFTEWWKDNAPEYAWIAPGK